MGSHIDDWLIELQGGGAPAGQALEKLYEEMYRPVFLLAASITNDTAMAEDAAHEVFITLRRQAAHYSPGSSGRAWIFSITRNVSRYLLRTARAEERKIQDMDAGAAEFEACVLEDIVIAKALEALKRQRVQNHCPARFRRLQPQGDRRPHGHALRHRSVAVSQGAREARRLLQRE